MPFRQNELSLLRVLVGCCHVVFYYHLDFWNENWNAPVPSIRVLGAVHQGSLQGDLCPNCNFCKSTHEILSYCDHGQGRACRFGHNTHIFASQLRAADVVSWVCVEGPQLRWYMVCIDWDNKFSLSWKHFSWRDFPRSIPFRNLYSTLLTLVNCHNWDGFTITYIASIGLLTQQRKKNMGCCFFVEEVQDRKK